MLFLRYVKDRVFLFLLFLLTIGTVYLFFYLENLPFLAAFDISIWIFTFFFLFLLSDFFYYRKKHRVLFHISRALPFSILTFPTPQTQIDWDYQKIISSLNTELRSMISQTDLKKAEMNDYYTLWVHQIKIPLSALQLMLEANPNYSYAEKMQEEIHRIEHYLDMLLQFLRLESFSGDLLIQPYPLDDILREVVKKNRNIFLRKKIAFDLQVPSFEVLTDRKWLSFVLEQILSNALKYTNKGKISIYMDKNKKNVLIIEDTGIGIPPEDLPRIWERGFTGYNGRIQNKSSGLGLYMCKSISDRLSMTLFISSAQEKGTRVYISFPNQKLETE